MIIQKQQNILTKKKIDKKKLKLGVRIKFGFCATEKFKKLSYLLNAGLIHIIEV